jgi:hypothetical protein
MDAIRNRAKGGPIKWPALNLTLYSGAVLSLGAILTLWHDAFESLFGYKPEENPGPAAAIFISLVLAVALIYAADLLTRGIASSNPGQVAPLPKGWQATVIKDGQDETGYSAGAVRVAAGGLQVLLVKPDQPAEWHQLGSNNGMVHINPPTGS